MNFLALSGLLTFILASVTTFAIIRNKSSEKTITLALFSAFISSWSLGIFIAFTSDIYEKVLFWSRFLNYSAIFIPVFYLHFVYSYLEIRKYRTKELFISYLLTAIYFLVSIVNIDQFVSGLEKNQFFKYYTTPGILYYIFPLFFSYFILKGYYFLYIAKKNASIKENLQINYFLIATILGLTGGSTTFGLVFGIPIYPFGAIFVAIMDAIIAYAITRDKFSNINLNRSTLLSRVIIYFSFILIAILINYFLTEEITKNYEKIILITLALIILCETYSFIIDKTKAFSEIILDKNRIILKNNASDFLKNTKEIKSIEELKIFLERFLRERMKVKLIGLYITNDKHFYEVNNSKKNINLDNNFINGALKQKTFFQNEDFLKSNGMTMDKQHLVIPFFSESKLISFALISSENRKFNNVDYEFYELMIDQVGIVVEKILAYEKIIFQEKKFLEQKNASLKSLAGSIAHELRNPLGAIKLATENLVSTKEKIKKEEDLQKIINQNSNFKKLIEEGNTKIINFKRQINKTIDLAGNVIDMTLHELAGKKFSKEDFVYYTAYKSVIDALTIYGYNDNSEKENVIIDFGNKKITAKDANKEGVLISDIDKNSNFIFHIEDTAFKYVIFNLVKNALFYLKDYPDSKVTINFEESKIIDHTLIDKFKLNPDITKYNIVNVTDTGPGIPKKIITKIFDSYFTSNKKGGTGVGLDFCQKVMNDFGGGIICQSELEKYTVFSLLFPILDEEEKKLAIKEITAIEDKKKKAIASGMSIEEAEKSTAKKVIKNILLIDDVKTNIEILARDIGKKCPNFNITIETDPMKALELVKSKQKEDKQFDLILTDIEMPEMDGIMLTEKIRRELNLSQDILPILAYSSRENQNVINTAKKVGVNTYYSKPKDLRFIARNISKWVLDDYIPNKNIYHQDIIINENTLKDQNIIIADDQLINLMVISKQFKKRGANITKCGDGKDIIKLLKENPIRYHLILTDINMKEIGGIEATKEVIKIQKEYNLKNSTNYKTPIIAISGDNYKEFVMKMLNNGINDYLTKGCSGSDMIKLSKFWIDYYHPDQISNSNNKGSNISELFTNKEEAEEIINIFDVEGYKILKEITKYKTDIVELKKAIHKLKGSSGSIGANRLFQYTSNINELLQKGKMPEDQDFDKKIKELFIEAIEVMKNRRVS